MTLGWFMHVGAGPYVIGLLIALDAAHRLGITTAQVMEWRASRR